MTTLDELRAAVERAAQFLQSLDQGDDQEIGKFFCATCDAYEDEPHKPNCETGQHLAVLRTLATMLARANDKGDKEGAYNMLLVFDEDSSFFIGGHWHSVLILPLPESTERKSGFVGGMDPKGDML